MPNQKLYKIDDILSDIESYAPISLAEEWDHVGLMIGDRYTSTGSVVLSLDTTREALEKCIKTKANLLITHHPLFFPSIGAIDYNQPEGALVRDLITNQICVYSAHTNLDKSQKGINYALATVVGLTMPMSITGVSYGLCGDLKNSQGLFSILTHLKTMLEGTGFFLNTDQDVQITRVFVAGGSFEGDCISNLNKAHVDLVITGEMKHHHMLDLRARGIAAVAIGHDVSERVVLPTIEKRLNLQFPGLGVAVESGLDYNRVVF